MKIRIARSDEKTDRPVILSFENDNGRGSLNTLSLKDVEFIVTGLVDATIEYLSKIENVNPRTKEEKDKEKAFKASIDEAMKEKFDWDSLEPAAQRTILRNKEFEILSKKIEQLKIDDYSMRDRINELKEELESTKENVLHLMYPPE